MLTLNYRDSRPIYEQIKDGLRRMIVTGAMAQDEKLPSVRALATQLSINPNTIQRAYNELEAEGYIYSVAGKGSFVSGTADADAARRENRDNHDPEKEERSLYTKGRKRQNRQAISIFNIQLVEY